MSEQKVGFRARSEKFPVHTWTGQSRLFSPFFCSIVLPTCSRILCTCLLHECRHILRKLIVCSCQSPTNLTAFYQACRPRLVEPVRTTIAAAHTDAQLCTKALMKKALRSFQSWNHTGKWSKLSDVDLRIRNKTLLSFLHCTTGGNNKWAKNFPWILDIFQPP